MHRQLMEESLDQMLLRFSKFLDSNIVTEDEKTLIEQSKIAFHATRQHARTRDVIVSVSESDNPEGWVGLRQSTAEYKELQEKSENSVTFFEMSKASYCKRSNSALPAPTMITEICQYDSAKIPTDWYRY